MALDTQTKNKQMKVIKKTIAYILGIAYYVTFYFAGHILLRVFRLCLAFSYVLLLEFKKAKDIIAHILK